VVLYFNTALSPNIGACHAFAPPPKSGNHKIGVLLLSPMYLFLLDDMIKAGGLQLRKQRVCSQLKPHALRVRLFIVIFTTAHFTMKTSNQKPSIALQASLVL
jgi:hypothetical protein